MSGTNNSMDWTEAVVTVGDGRGFVVGNGYVVTAAHCLPKIPFPHARLPLEERTYPHILGCLGDSPTIWAECVFADPFSDVAVLTTPDDQELYEFAKEYQEWLDTHTGLHIGVPKSGASYVLSLTDEVQECNVGLLGGPIVELTGANTEGGMSGSPVVNGDGEAIGIVNVGGEYESEGRATISPVIASVLPKWLLEAIQHG